ncbi:hypothetical protein ELI25_34195 [Rhizobium ruizarguesonis]|nr:hypothetical protein ELI25_34195 [Rhizobium ruizarguesonis]TAZ50583.1 hypothetical protein ELH76_05045 [Rhizobium ruizarguesonis]
MSLCYSQLTLPDRRRLFHLRERKVPVSEKALLRQPAAERPGVPQCMRMSPFMSDSSCRQAAQSGVLWYIPF